MATQNDTARDTSQPLAQALDQNAALLHLLCGWDVNAPPHELHAQFTAIETCARNSEIFLCNAIEARREEAARGALMRAS
jgi:hypothetical protein